MSKSELKLCLYAMPFLIGFVVFLVATGIGGDRNLGIIFSLGVIAGFIGDIVIILYNVYFGDKDRG